MTDVIYCNRCGVPNSALARFCANCGTPFSVDTATPPAIDEVVPRPQGPADAIETPPAQQTAYEWPLAAPSSPAVRYGGFWIRFVAVIIDGIALGVVVWPVSAILAVMIGAAGAGVDMPGVGIHVVRIAVVWALFVFAGWIYEAGMESSSKQATLGKMALGLKVTDEYGNRISFARATARYFCKFLSRMILLIGYIMAGFTARKQALHDMIAGTLVVRTQ